MENNSNKKRIDFKKIFSKKNIEDTYNNLESNIPSLVITVICSLLVMAFICCAVFFARVKGPETVLTPDVVGMQLEDALFIIKDKQLFPKITLRYSDEGIEKGIIMEQSPKKKSLVKGRSDIELIVSRGPVLDTVENYVGSNIDEVAENTDDSKKKSVITFDYPIYKYDDAPKGTIIAQNIKEGTQLYSKKNVQLVVSKGKEKDTVAVPDMFNKSLEQFYSEIQNVNLIFDVTSHLAIDDEKIGFITSKKNIDTIDEFEHVSIDFAFPAESKDDLYYGIYENELINYPVPVKLKIETIDLDGEKNILTEFYHKGGHVTVPYALKKGTQMYMYVNNKMISKFEIQ